MNTMFEPSSAARTRASASSAAALPLSGVGIGDDELDALHALADHVLDSVAAAAAHADHLDACTLVEFFDHFDGHGDLLQSCVSSCQ
jgi:hypothetical protein